MGDSSNAARRSAPRVVVLGDGGRLRRCVREELESQGWRVMSVDAEVRDLPRLDGAAGVVAVSDCIERAAELVGRVVRTGCELPVVAVLAEGADPPTRSALQNEGAADCVAGADVRAAPVACWVRQALDAALLRRQLGSLRAQLSAIDAARRNRQAAVTSTARALRSSAFTVLAAIDALKLRGATSASPEAAEAVELVRESIRAMITLTDDLAGS